MILNCRQLATATLLAVLTAVAGAQTAAPMPTASDAKDGMKTPSNLPPGAKSAKGDKAATPASGSAASGTDMPANPDTGSTSGMAPGAKSSKGDKAMTPKSQGKPASGAM